MTKSIFHTSIVAMSLIATASFSGQVSASDCKGLTNQACASAQTCLWVDGYERKDGRQVKSFCRTKYTAKKKPALTSKAVSQVKALGK